MPGCPVFPFFPSAASLLLSCALDQLMGAGTGEYPKDPLVLTASQRRPGPGREEMTCSLSVKKLVPLLGWDQGAGFLSLSFVYTVPFPTAPPSPFLFLCPLSCHFCLGFRVLPYPGSLSMFPYVFLFSPPVSLSSFSGILGRGAVPGPCVPLPPILPVLRTLVVTCMPKTPETLPKLLQWGLRSTLPLRTYLRLLGAELCGGGVAVSVALSGVDGGYS